MPRGPDAPKGLVASSVARFVLFAFFLCLTCGLGSCLRGSPRAVQLGPPVESGSLGVGDVIEVLVYDEPAMSKTYKVAPDGTIDFPFVGALEVEGKEPQEIGRALKARLRTEKILKNPQVSVLVKEVNSKKVAVFGQVQKPGQFPLAEGMTVTHAISMAGGFTAMADRDRVTITRRVSKEKMVRVVFSVAAIVEGKIPDVALQAGDTIYVEESWA
jgi:protein involved in polysaccharide export with SLBB domain